MYCMFILHVYVLFFLFKGILLVENRTFSCSLLYKLIIMKNLVKFMINPYKFQIIQKKVNLLRKLDKIKNISTHIWRPPSLSELILYWISWGLGGLHLHCLVVTQHCLGGLQIYYIVYDQTDNDNDCNINNSWFNIAIIY